MAERTLIVDHKTISYEGLFNAKELYRLVNNWFFTKGYDMFEKKNFEHVYPSGKQMEIEIWPWRKTTDYARMLFKLHFLFTNVKEVEIKKDGLKTKMNQGKVIITLNGYIETDYEKKWEQKAIFVFMRTIFDKFVYSVHTGRYESQLIDESNHLIHMMKGYLNVQRF